MKVFINDLSIIGQASNESEAMDILFHLAIVVARTRDISFGKKAYRTRTLGDKIITGSSTVKEVLVASSNRGGALDERQRKLAIEVFLKQPYSENYHSRENDAITDSSGNCLKESCFDSAASCIGSPLTVSAKNCQAYGLPSTSIHSSIWGVKTVLNVTDEIGLSGLMWTFENNPKHKMKEYRAAGELVSIMDLSATDAQLALNNGIKINSKIYSYFNNSWYQFHCHHGNNYHGFKVELEENNPEHMKALSILNNLTHTPYGQIFS